MFDLVGNPEDRFSHNEAHIMIGNNKASDQTVHILLLIYAFAVCIDKIQVF